MELLSAEGLRALGENAGWQQTEAARLVFAIAALLLLALLLGGLWELWQLRFGRTHESGKKVVVCKKFLAWGPQMLKHKYAAVLVLARDLAHCAAAGRARLQYSSLRQGVQRFLALRTGVATSCVSAHCWDGAHWIESKASMPKAVLCKKLEFHAGYAEWVMETDMRGVGVLDVLRRFCMTVLAAHPLLDAMRVGAGSMTVLKRVSLQFCGIAGVLASNAMIFSFSGEMSSWAADATCPIKPTSQLFILVATLVSFLLSVAPNAFLADVGRQVHGRPFWNALFWLLALFYFGAAAFVVAAALANLNTKDSKKWHAATEWAVLIKFLAMPLAQGLRHSILLETFLHLDRKCEPARRFPVVMGCRLAKEPELDAEARCSVERMAGESISATELVNFTSLLGDKVFFEYEESSSTEEVLQKAIRPLCAKAPSLEELRVLVEVQGAQGLCSSAEALWSCSVAHLGEELGRERPCLREEVSEGLCAEASACAWAFRASVPGLAATHALAFAVRLKSEVVGMAWLPAEDVVRSKGWQGALPLRSFEGGWRQAGAVPFKELEASRGAERRALEMASIDVNVSLPEGYTRALACHALQRCKLNTPAHDSEAQDRSLEFGLARSAEPGEDYGGFCDVVLHEAMPPDRVVVHSRKGSFSQLVACILTDALGKAGDQEELRGMLQRRDFHGLLDMLEAAGAGGTRYWLEVFAMDPLLSGNSSSQRWHEELLAGLPSILRLLRKASCSKMVADIKAGRESRHGPLKQLLVLDEAFHFLRERSCLAEVMLAKSMCLRQRVLLRPQDLAGLEAEMRRLSLELSAPFEDEELPWTVPFLQDRAKVFRTLMELMVASAREQRPDHNALWYSLELGDVAATVAAAQAARGRQGEAGANDVGDMDAEAELEVDG